MKIKLLLIGLTCLVAKAAWALSLAEAGENLLYFEHAKASAQYCEKRGTPAASALKAWQAKEEPFYLQTVETIREQARQRGMGKADQDSVIAQSMAGQRKGADQHVSEKGVNCENFPAVLEMYSRLLKR